MYILYISEMKFVCVVFAYVHMCSSLGMPITSQQKKKNPTNPNTNYKYISQKNPKKTPELQHHHGGTPCVQWLCLNPKHTLNWIELKQGKTCCQQPNTKPPQKKQLIEATCSNNIPSNGKTSQVNTLSCNKSKMSDVEWWQVSVDVRVCEGIYTLWL